MMRLRDGGNGRRRSARFHSADVPVPSYREHLFRERRFLAARGRDVGVPREYFPEIARSGIRCSATALSDICVSSART
jgi:hypothetical protein